MRKVSCLIAGISLVLIIALMGCGYAKKDEVEAQLADQKAEADQKIQLAQDAAAQASEKADKVLGTAREEIEKAKSEVITTAEEKDSEALATAKSSMESGDAEVKRFAEDAAEKALADANANAMAEDEKVKQMAKAAADKALSAAEEADRKAEDAAEEAELAKTLPEIKEPIVFSVYFDLGQAKLKKEALAKLEEAANAIKAHPGASVKVHGHTDNVPVIHSARYKNNWDLSQDRAKVVSDHLVSKLGIPAERIEEAMGMAFYEPIAPNTVKGRAKNRRTDIVIMP